LTQEGITLGDLNNPPGFIDLLIYFRSVDLEMLMREWDTPYLRAIVALDIPVRRQVCFPLSLRVHIYIRIFRRIHIHSHVHVNPPVASHIPIPKRILGIDYVQMNIEVGVRSCKCLNERGCIANR
jgi:hypothetical protein